jgi:membrane protease YdiL (CAAX protease family)
MSAMDELRPDKTVRLALLFEGGLGVTALVLGWLVGHWPLIGLGSPTHASEQIAAVGWGLVATGPLLVALLVMDRLPLAPLVRLRELVSQIILRMFGGASTTQLAIISVAAGIGEELLFRGLIQAGLSRLMGEYGPLIALIATSALFGICHWLNTTYALLAMIAGAYFGVLLLATDNILTPIVAHAAYDFVALVYLVRPGNVIRSEE